MTAAQFNRLWDKVEASIVRRRWDYIRGTWLKHLPIIAPAGAQPDRTIADLVGELVPDIPTTNNHVQEFSFPSGEIPALLAREAIYWLHKALHILGAAECHADGGMPTWSLSSAYQSAYFSARASMAFLGVGVAELEKVSFLVDVSHDMQLMSPREYAAVGAFSDDARFYTLGVLFDHRQIWHLYQRVLRVTTRVPWPEPLNSYLGQLNVAEITKQRHLLHYQLRGWVFDDLFDFVFAHEFDRTSPSGSGRTLFDSDKPEFTFVLAVALLRTALDPFVDICRYSNRLADEEALLIASLPAERHPILFERLQRICGSAEAIPL